MRLIDANDLFERVGNIKPKNKIQYEQIGQFMNMITNSPTIIQIERPITKVIVHGVEYVPVKKKCLK